jgi:hypothetical protein
LASFLSLFFHLFCWMRGSIPTMYFFFFRLHLSISLFFLIQTHQRTPQKQIREHVHPSQLKLKKNTNYCGLEQFLSLEGLLWCFLVSDYFHSPKKYNLQPCSPIATDTRTRANKHTLEEKRLKGAESGFYLSLSCLSLSIESVD